MDVLRRARARVRALSGSGPNTLWLPSSIHTSPSVPVAQLPSAMRCASTALNSPSAPPTAGSSAARA
jgi:hypothetical protein